MNIELEKIRGIKDALAIFVATAGGAGFIPKAPGTAGAAVAVPLAFYSAGWTTESRALLWVGLTAIGAWSARMIDEIMGSSDNQSIVIDEVVGLGITAWTAGTDLKALLVAFVLFRFFDVVKLPPVRALDHWSKKKALESGSASKWWGGFGVIGDDILAGFQGLAVMVLLQYYGIL
ncbi:MAG: hypothetical protein A2Z97_16590 [Bdellovibrionales bacterium GWB1_52_6]|nr:MAG: hypothetical protein A2Z97_16590 [Bdellovibrionales bacterium GWB1_52_6]OFZ05084.1 MAG: hypothetical protein A2X97_00640 [Bdellovibrionales bacterium GWA1_52_35]